MYVACPSCQSLFGITAAHLRAAHGQVRCGVCQNRFNASDAVFEDPRQALAWAEQHVVREIDELVDKALDQVPGPDAFAGQAADEQPAPRAREAWRFHADADFYAQPNAAEYSTAQQADSDRYADMPPATLFEEDGAGAHWGTIAAALFLTLLLAAQYTFAERHRLAAVPQLRPVLETFCGLLRCDLPLRRDAGSVEMVEREVTNHPNVDDAVLINAMFVNRAGFRQAYPLLQVSFSDVSGTPVALRRFRPHEYLDAGIDPSLGMGPGERVHLTLEVIDPGDRAVSFQFDFL